MQTPISHSFNLSHGARLANFNGWQMPTFYTSILEEHKATRTHIGLFDVSHMGRWWISGKDASKFLEHLTSNSISNLQSGRGLYTLMLNPKGGIIDDLIIYKINDYKFLLVNNAGNHQTDTDWLQQNAKGFAVALEDITLDWGQIAIQGPNAKAATEKLLGLNTGLRYFGFEILDDLIDLSRNHSDQGLQVRRSEAYSVANEHSEEGRNAGMGDFGASLMIAATGYTGEDGYEIYGKPKSLMQIWTQLINNNSASACGLGSRDLLRLEAGYLLHGNDMDQDTSPYEAGLDWVVKLDTNFIGKDFCKYQNKKIIGLNFATNCKILPRHGMNLIDTDDNVIGFISSANFSPTLNRAIALAYLYTNDSDVYVNIRGQKLKADITSTRFYSGIKKAIIK
jgi:aminomethyltransferase